MQDVSFYSAALAREMPYRIILPKAIPPGTRLPAVYLLHGGGGGYRDWSNYSDVAKFAESGVVLIMPEGNSSYYVNSATISQDRYEDYIVRDLISDVESKFPVAPARDKRSIVGISMGGFGAIVLTLRHPDTFIFSGALSPAIDVPARRFSWKRIGQYRQHAKIFGDWGSSTRRDNDPFLIVGRVDAAKIPHLFISCGEQEGLFPANERFTSILKRRGFDYEFHAGPGGHNWNQWNARLEGVFASLSAHTM